MMVTEKVTRAGDMVTWTGEYILSFNMLSIHSCMQCAMTKLHQNSSKPGYPGYSIIFSKRQMQAYICAINDNTDIQVSATSMVGHELPLLNTGYTLDQSAASVYKHRLTLDQSAASVINTD